MTTKSKKSKTAKAAKPKTASTKAAPKKSAPKKTVPQKPTIPAASTKLLQMVAVQTGAAPVRKDSKLNALIKLLSRPEGATLEDMITETSWQKHTVRSALSHALGKKRRYDIVSDKPKDGSRIYKIVSLPRAENSPEE